MEEEGKDEEIKMEGRRRGEVKCKKRKTEGNIVERQQKSMGRGKRNNDKK